MDPFCGSGAILFRESKPEWVTTEPIRSYSASARNQGPTRVAKARENLVTKEPSTSEVLQIIGKLEHFINGSEYMPATRFYRSKVLLALISKALTTGRAVCTLVDAGFAGEAFGLSRTLAEIFFYVRYISNKDTEERARQYAEHFGKVQEELLRVARKHYPDKPLPQLDKKLLELAKKYKNPHSWTDLRGQAKIMAFEADAYEMDSAGNPIKQDFDYEYIYWQTSQYVHATILSLVGHGVESEESFHIRQNIEDEIGRSHEALYNVLVFIPKIFVCAFRALRDEQPSEILQEAMELLRSCGPEALTAVTPS
jgi:uncharacterized protein DUF5677